METPFDFKRSQWTIKWPGRLSKHDLVYLSPPVDPMQGMPMGNGDIGVLCWCEESRIVFAVNKCDLWDDAKFGRFKNWKPEEEEYSTTLRHACRIILDFHMPLLDLFYLTDFNGRLSLADASLELSLCGPFGSVSVKAFVSHEEGVFCCHVDSKLTENKIIDIMMERYGSRTFSHWYRLVNRDASIGLGGTDSVCDKDGIYLTHKLSGSTFSAGCTVIGDNELEKQHSIDHSHCAKISMSGGSDKRFTFVAAVTEPLENTQVNNMVVVNEVKKILNCAVQKGMDAIFKDHKDAWKDFWMHSLMEFGDDYLDNLWYLNMYYANASQRGKYPGRFISGLWTWARDVQQWNFYFHWNQQEIYWPLNAAGHHDLMGPYLEYRYNSLAHAKEDAREIFKTEGAVVSDVCDRRGYNSENEFLNHTPVAEIAMDFWRQYQYTGDRDFLTNRALPYMREAALFFESLFGEGEDGKIHAKRGTGYEGWIELSDGTTELVYARVLFAAVINAYAEAGLDDPHIEKWEKILSDLADLPVVEADPECIARENECYRLNKGAFKGDLTTGNKVLSAGYGIKEGRMLFSMVPDPSIDKAQESEPVNSVDMLHMLVDNKSNYTALKRDMMTYHGIFPCVEYSVLFPSNLLGLSQAGTELFTAAVNTAKLYAPTVMGFDPLPITLARLGLSRELARILNDFPSVWQMYCNGFGQYGPLDIVKADSMLRFRTNMVSDASIKAKGQDEELFPFPQWPFRHMGMESMAVLSCAMNEALLQGHERIIRVAPAVCETQNARFTLHAPGGFVVSSEIAAGKVLWVSVKSLHGSRLIMENPWETAYVFQHDKEAGCFDRKDIELSTLKSGIYTIYPEREMIDTCTVKQEEYEENQNPKRRTDGKAMLGIPRLF